MGRSGKIAAVVTPLLFVASLLRVQVILAATTLAFSATGLQARMETPEEVEKILAFLEAENCEIRRDAMGEKKLSTEGESFIVEATCAGEKPYTFTLDQNFKVIDKKDIEN